MVARLLDSAEQAMPGIVDEDVDTLEPLNPDPEIRESSSSSSSIYWASAPMKEPIFLRRSMEMARVFRALELAGPLTQAFSLSSWPQDYVLLTASASARELGFLVPPADATKGRISLSPRGEFLLPPWGDWKNLLASPSPGTQADQAQGPSLDACNLLRISS
jgi:hypothetical protein